MAALLMGLVVGSLGLAGACTRPDDEPAVGDPTLPTLGAGATPGVSASEGTTTTTTEADAVAAVDALTPEEIESRLRAAVDARDFCALAEALGVVVVDVEDAAAVIRTYEVLAKAVEDATPFVPSELADPWLQINEATRRTYDAARRAGGNVADPTVSSAFTSPPFTAAYNSVDQWTEKSCAG